MNVLLLTLNRAMFLSNMRESTSKVIKITSADFNTFKTLIEYVYLDKVTFPKELGKIRDLLLLATQYNMARLKVFLVTDKDLII